MISDLCFRTIANNLQSGGVNSVPTSSSCVSLNKVYNLSVFWIPRLEIKLDFNYFS